MLQVQSVNQLLQVLDFTRRSHSRGTSLTAAYQDAIRDVSSRHHVRYQTIGDLCRRRLALGDIADFVNLLERWLRGDPEPLKFRILEHSVSAAHLGINGFFGGGEAPRPSPSGLSASGAPGPDAHMPERTPDFPYEEIRLRVPAALSKRIHLAQLAKIGTTREEAAIALIERGFESEKGRIRDLLASL